MHVLWIRNCTHALSGLAGSQRTLLDMQHRAAGGRHGRHLESMTSHKNHIATHLVVIVLLVPLFHIFLIWPNNFKMAAMTSFHAAKCCHLVNGHSAPTRQRPSVPHQHSYLLFQQAFELLLPSTR